MAKFEVKEVCKSCDGTGIYVGMAERDGAGVVCSKCKGTGCHHLVYEYELFEKRKEHSKVKWVYECNPGICIGNTEDYRLEDFGGKPYGTWLFDSSFYIGQEMRKFTCPAWWYQVSNYSLKPNWDECILFESFNKCEHFSNKQKCWDKFDNEIRENKK